MGLTVAPCTLREAWLFVRLHHRHHDPSRGGKFALCAVDESGAVRGVAVVSRPVNHHHQDGWTAEVVRVATDGARNAPSLLYRACWRAAKGMGYRRLITYTLPSEGGASLRGAGWVLVDAATREPVWTRKGRAVQTLRLPGAKWLWEVRSPHPSCPAPTFNLANPTARLRLASPAG